MQKLFRSLSKGCGSSNSKPLYFIDLQTASAGSESKRCSLSCRMRPRLEHRGTQRKYTKLSPISGQRVISKYIFHTQRRCFSRNRSPYKSTVRTTSSKHESYYLAFKRARVCVAYYLAAYLPKVFLLSGERLEGHERRAYCAIYGLSRALSWMWL